ncbi:3'-5' exonuclease [Microvirga sp. VF16]|uniref:3'-5' exonuclease n=1 Tax=Microvirga sp. VF16 TaxID=2807101 RepID=UPI00193C8F37|nr:3'-5' exonuclease [Microvirga sp. VF16]QRM33185.1 3'-5' exonuclease [Microvirga sp. VF16]
MSGQADLFLGFDAPLVPIETQRSRGPAPVRRQPRHELAEASSFKLNPAHYDAAAQALQETGRYRVLRELMPRPIISDRTMDDGERIGIIVDTETTGKDATDEVIELGMVAFTFNEAGQIGDVIGVFNALRQPAVPISPEAMKVHKITPEMVKGHVLDLDEVERFLEPAHLLIAHNASFDRPFCERLARGFSVKAWACSNSEIAWAEHGFEGTKLAYLLGQCGWFHHGHRATDDCHALLEVLCHPLPDEAGSPFARLLNTARKPRFRIWAESTPFEQKDVLKRRSYRWNDGSNGRPKSWWIEVGEEALEAEVAFLRDEVYRRELEPFIQKITAFERFRF